MTQQASDLPGWRRIVTGHDAKGLSVVVSDGPATNLAGPEAEPFLVNFWATATDSNRDDPARGRIPLGPVPGGTTFRFFRVPPEASFAGVDPEELRKGIAAYYRDVGAPHAHDANARHPGFHRTPTTDYIVLLEGEITLMLDEGDVAMKPFDVVIQRGTNHAWVNHGSTTALLMAVLVDDPELRS